MISHQFRFIKMIKNVCCPTCDNHCMGVYHIQRTCHFDHFASDLCTLVLSVNKNCTSDRYCMQRLWSQKNGLRLKQHIAWCCCTQGRDLPKIYWIDKRLTASSEKIILTILLSENIPPERQSELLDEAKPWPGFCVKSKFRKKHVLFFVTAKNKTFSCLQAVQAVLKLDKTC